MSGYYDKETGIFKLPQWKADHWYQGGDRTAVAPESCQGLWGLKFYAELLRSHGLEVIKTTRYDVIVRATPEAIWEALTGLPSDAERVKYYYR